MYLISHENLINMYMYLQHSEQKKHFNISVNPNLMGTELI